MGNGTPLGNGSIPRPNAEQMREMSARMKENPDMMKQMFDMSPEQLQQMVRNQSACMCGTVLQ